MEILMRSVVPNRTPPGGAAVSPRVIPPAAPITVAAPAAPVAPELSPTARYVQDMQTLMQGGLGKLSTGEKISALGQVLQAAGSRGAADPSAVLQNVRNQQMQKLNAQYQIAQLQQKMQQEQQQKAAIDKYKIALEPDQINALEGLPLEDQAKKVAEIAFREDQVREVRKGNDGVTRYIFVSGKSKPADFDLPTGYEKLDTGNGFKFYNKDNPTEFLKDASGNEVFVPQQMTAYQRESLGLRRQEIAKRGASGGGTTNLPQPTVKIVNGKPSYVQWDKRAQKYVPFKQAGLTAPSKADIALSSLSPQAMALLGTATNIE
jgi:hypothetical protein